MAESYEVPTEAESGGNVLVPNQPTAESGGATTEPGGQQAPTEPQRPAWLPEKFARPEDLALAYANLEARQGQQGGQAKPEGNEEGQQAPTGPKVLDQGVMQSLYDEFAQLGQLSPQSYNMLLNDYSLDRTVVDSHISALQGQAAAQAQVVYDMVGGQEEYSAMVAWAQRELTPEKRAGYDDMIGRANASGSMELVRVAVQQLQNEWRASEGQRQRQPTAFAQPAPGGEQSGFGPVTPFKSDEELHAAQADPRYHTRADYREWVYRRINAGGI